MSRRMTVWRAAAVVFGIINILGLGYAVAMREVPHGAVHAALLLATGVVWVTLARARVAEPDALSLQDARLENLQQSLDAVAIEVERIGEAQRFDAKLRAERGVTPS